MNTSKTKHTDYHIKASDVFLRVANADDIPAIEALLNTCYRQPVGWTNEAHLIRGIRTTPDSLQRIIDNTQQNQQFLLVYPQTEQTTATHKETGKILACIHIEMTTIKVIKNGGNFTVLDTDVSAVKDNIQILIQPATSLGMFAVAPSLQNRGIGKKVLSLAEQFAYQQAMAINTKACYDNTLGFAIVLYILNDRPELLSYYQRRGYHLTNNSLPFPNDGKNGVPIKDSLYLRQLIKFMR